MVEPTQSGTFVGGLIQGFQTGEQIQANRAKRKRQQKRFEAEQELNELKTEATKIELENAKAQQRRDEALRHLDTAVRAKDSGNTELASQEFKKGINTLDLSVEDFTPEFAQAANTLERKFKEPDSVSQDEAIAAANRVFRNQVQKGVGEETTRNGKKVKVTDKEITEIAPAPTDDGRGNELEPGIMARMRVTGETEDGETVVWRAPLTANRSTRDDDPAEGVPVDEIARQIVGKRSIMTGLAQSPQFREMLRTARTRAGEDPESIKRTVTGEEIGLSGGLFQVDRETGEISEVVEPDEPEQADFGTTEIKRGDDIVTMLTRDGVPTKALAEAPRDESERQRKIDALASRPGVSEDDAVDIVDGVKELTEPDQFGRQFIVDKLTGEREQVVERGERQDQSGQGRSSGAAGEVRDEADDSGEVSREGVDIEGAVEEGTGPFAQMRSLVNSTIGPFVEGAPFKDTEAAKENIRLFNFKMQQAFAQNDGRLSNFEREIIQRFQPNPDKVFTDPDTERQKIVEMRSFLEKQMEQNRQSMESGDITEDQRGELANQNATIERLLSIMGDAGQQQRFTADSPAKPETQEEFEQLPSGAVFVNPANGELRRKQ